MKQKILEKLHQQKNNKLNVDIPIKDDLKIISLETYPNTTIVWICFNNNTCNEWENCPYTDLIKID
jgi:hypothetical protein